GRSGRDAEDLLDFVAVQIGANTFQLFLFGQFGDTPLDVVVGAGQGGGLAPVAGGAVRPGEHVQTFQLFTRVAGVAPHRRVGPLPLAVAVEAQVKGDQGTDRRDHVLGETQFSEALATHGRTHHLVVVEG